MEISVVYCFTCLAPFVGKSRRGGCNRAAWIGKLRRVKRWYYLVLGAILICGIVYIYFHRQSLGITGNSGDAADTSSPQPARITWVAVDRAPEGFKLEMPADTRQVEVPAYNETGGADQVDMIYSYPDSVTSYSIAWKDNPPVERAARENPDTTLDNARDGALTRTEAVLVTESRSTTQGYPTRDFVGRNESGGIFNARLILAGQRLYLLMAAFPAASARRDADVNHFFDSFQVLNAAQNK